MKTLSGSSTAPFSSGEDSASCGTSFFWWTCFSSWYILRRHCQLNASLQDPQDDDDDDDVQFLEIAVGDIIATPIRHSVELYTMRKLHLNVVKKPS